MSIDTDLQVTITAMAQETILNCQNRIHAVRAAFGEQEGDRLAASFGRSFTKLISMGGTISRDSEFGLLGYNYMTVGMVFFPEDQVTTYKRWMAHERDLFDSDEFLRTLPASGEWSLHS
jgi:hypothetical protein